MASAPSMWNLSPSARTSDQHFAICNPLLRDRRVRILDTGSRRRVALEPIQPRGQLRSPWNSLLASAALGNIHGRLPYCRYLAVLMGVRDDIDAFATHARPCHLSNTRQMLNVLLKPMHNRHHSVGGCGQYLCIQRVPCLPATW